MGEEREDSQKLKKMAAAAYDYENDPRWADYWSNVLIPPHMASRSDVVDHFKRKFYQRYIVFIVAVLAIFPLVTRTLSIRAYRLSFMGTACSALYSLYALYGIPRAWNLQAIQVYFQSIITTKDFIYFIYSLTFVTSHLCLKFALIPILCRALEHVAKFLRRNFNRSTLYRKYLENPCLWVESNTTTLSILSSHAEIGVGFLLIISLSVMLLSSVTSFFYWLTIVWMLLKLMYRAPVTTGYHQSVWAKIGRMVNPLVQQYAPFLNGPVSAIQQWWLR
ncbi:hypothetical protein Gotur_004663 [Gossypium turneri]